MELVVKVGRILAYCPHCNSGVFVLSRARIDGRPNYVCNACRTRTSRAELVSQIAGRIGSDPQVS